MTFKILPASNGTYSVSFVGATSLDDQVISISPIDADSGFPASATQGAVGSLRSGVRTNGALVVTTSSSIHIFKPAAAKGAHKTFDDSLCDSAAITRFADRGVALVALFGDGSARAYSLPALKEIAKPKSPTSSTSSASPTPSSRPQAISSAGRDRARWRCSMSGARASLYRRAGTTSSTPTRPFRLGQPSRTCNGSAARSTSHRATWIS